MIQSRKLPIQISRFAFRATLETDQSNRDLVRNDEKAFVAKTVKPPLSATTKISIAR